MKQGMGSLASLANGRPVGRLDARRQKRGGLGRGKVTGERIGRNGSAGHGEAWTLNRGESWDDFTVIRPVS